jgi:hypothetical protein
MACFGSPKFDRQQALHILSADSRFPDLTPGKQLAAGNHFLAMFPEPTLKKQRLRGGENANANEPSSSGGVLVVEEEEETDDSSSSSSQLKPTHWWSRLYLPSFSSSSGSS